MQVINKQCAESPQTIWPKLDSNQRPRTYQVRALPPKLLDHSNIKL